jgi:hypothetical protein
MPAAAQSITPEVANQYLVDALQQLEVTVAQALPLQNSPDDQFALDTRIAIARDVAYTLVSVSGSLSNISFGNMLIFTAKFIHYLRSCGDYGATWTPVHGCRNLYLPSRHGRFGSCPGLDQKLD